jgi:hypothetical protein
MDYRVLCLLFAFQFSIASLCSQNVLGQDAPAAEVVVRLQSGRSFTGFVDPKTDSETLWMRFEKSGKIKIMRPVAWHRIVEIVAGGEVHDPDGFRDQVDQWTSTTNVYPQWGGDSTAALQVRKSLDFHPHVTTIVAAARLAQWDNDARVDGLEVLLTPLDATGQMASVAGTVTLEFIVPRAVDREQSPRQHGVRFATIARAIHLVAATEYGPDGVVVRLPFRQNDPLANTDWANAGILHVRFVVPGSGVFRASVDDVRTRPFSPIRDLHERAHGHRYLPGE